MTSEEIGELSVFGINRWPAFLRDSANAQYDGERFNPDLSEYFVFMKGVLAGALALAEHLEREERNST